MRLSPAIVAAALAAPFFSMPATAETPPPARIVSINLCADELLLALADPGQILALSPYSVDPELSFLAEEATAFRHDAGEAETVVELEPDLVLAGRFTKLATRDLLARLGYRVVVVEAARSIDQSIAQIRDIAKTVGHPQRGEKLIARIETARQRARRNGEGQQTSAAVYQRRGYVTGGETLTADLLSTVGIADIGGRLAGRTGRFVPLERIISTRPDYLIVASANHRPEDQGSALLAHPALARLYPEQRRVVLPQRLTICAGPSLPDALDWLAAEAARVAGGQ